MLIDIIYSKCPDCNTIISHTIPVSYTIIGSSDCWSDGRSISPNLPEYSFLPFTKCKVCNSFFWFDDCEKADKNEISQIADLQSINSADDYPPPEYWINIFEYMIIDFLKILETVDSTHSEREIYIRIKLWQHINDLIRFSKHTLIKHVKIFFSLRKQFKLSELKYDLKLSKHNKHLYLSYKQLCLNNLTRLTELLQNSLSVVENQITLIEIYRQLGDFEKAKALTDNFKSIKSGDYYLFIKMSRKYLSKKSTKTFKI